MNDNMFPSEITLKKNSKAFISKKGLINTTFRNARVGKG